MFILIRTSFWRILNSMRTVVIRPGWKLASIAGLILVGLAFGVRADAGAGRALPATGRSAFPTTGCHAVTARISGAASRTVPGVYVCRMLAGDFVVTRQIVIVAQ